MTGFEIIILLIVIVASAVILGYYFSYGQPSLKDMEEGTPTTPDVTKARLTQSAQELVKEIEKVTKTPTTQEESQKLVNDLVEIATPSPKKKRKYYPKKKKQEDN